MKTLRMSRSTENRNAHKTMSWRGGVRRGAARLPEGQMLVSGRRLRRAERSRKSRLQAYVIGEDGTLGRPAFAPVQGVDPGRPTMTADIDPFTRAVLGVRLI